jgi:hypothetical protein
MKEISVSAVLDALGDLHFRGGVTGKLAYSEFWESARNPEYTIANQSALVLLRDRGLLGATDVKVTQTLRLALACP